MKFHHFSPLENRFGYLSKNPLLTPLPVKILPMPMLLGIVVSSKKSSKFSE